MVTSPGRRAEPVPCPGVRHPRDGDLRFTAEVHASALSHGFFARLGRRFLRTYHASFHTSPYGVLLVAQTDTDVAEGFLAGTLDNEAHYRWVARHGAFRLATRGALALVCRPRTAALFLRTRAGRYVRTLARRLWGVAASGRSSSSAPAGPPTTASASGPPGDASAMGLGPVAVLTHVAVCRQARGHGAGRRLVERFVELARVAGAREVRLVSPVDTGAPSFYRRLGWRSYGVRTDRTGTVVEEFRLPLHAATDPGD